MNKFIGNRLNLITDQDPGICFELPVPGATTALLIWSTDFDTRFVWSIEQVFNFVHFVMTEFVVHISKRL